MGSNAKKSPTGGTSATPDVINVQLSLGCAQELLLALSAAFNSGGGKGKKGGGKKSGGK